MFNYYNWGGYLLWRLAPSKVFIDGRNADRDLYDSYRRILQGEGAAVGHGPPFWKTQLQRYDVHFTITPMFDPVSGELFGLLDKLIADPAWVPVFVSATTVVFAEDVPANRAVISVNALPKEQFFRFLLKLCTDIISVNPGYVQALVARGDVLLRLGDRAGALRSFEEALRMAPQVPYARARVEKLRARRE
jgi:tetratricopeptide (TPR) repeat protein